MAHPTSTLPRLTPSPLHQQQFNNSDNIPNPPRRNMSFSSPSPLLGATVVTPNTSLPSLTPQSSAGLPSSNQVVATGNIINQKADAKRSLYQICVSLKQRLALVPGFEVYLEGLDRALLEKADAGPVEALWELLRTGHPLLTIYNALRPENPLRVDDNKLSEAKQSKVAILKFVQACKNNLAMPASDCFIIQDLTGEDTNGFTKATHVINHVLDLAERDGCLYQAKTPQGDADGDAAGTGEVKKMTYRDYIVREVVDTERKYVQDLENLYDLKKTLETSGNFTGDILHGIFMNIHGILDFQRRFLVRVEILNSNPHERQDWGSLFYNFESNFEVYQPFIANQRKAAQIASSVFDRIQATGHPCAVDFHTLDSFLLKPMQRLVKYPLLLKDLLKRSENDQAKADLEAGIAAAEHILQCANKAVDQAILQETREDLLTRVDETKKSSLATSGNLLLHGQHQVVANKGDQEKEYEIYLFEGILVCCKDYSKKDKTKSGGFRNTKTKGGKLQVKGRIYTSNVTDVVAMSKPGHYSVQIYWKGDPGVETFTIRFNTEETMKKWSEVLDQQRREKARPTNQSPDQPPLDFAWMQNQGISNLENPYAQPDEDEEDDSINESTPTRSQYGMLQLKELPLVSRSASFRQRSTTTASTNTTSSSTGDGAPGGPMGGVSRAPPARYQPYNPTNAQQPTPLSLQTQISSVTAQSSAGTRGPAESYFSPATESPTSSRTSMTSSMFTQSSGSTAPKGNAPHSNLSRTSTTWDNRYTAPAISRAPSRDGPSPVSAYGPTGANGRNPRGPSLPVMASQAGQIQQQQQRGRSYSTPDINGQAGNAHRANGHGIPAVPGIPSHLHPSAHHLHQNPPSNHPHAPHHERHSSLSRSNTASPAIDHPPTRANTQSPGMPRERGGGDIPYNGRLSQFPSQPIYSRQGTPANASSPLTQATTTGGAGAKVANGRTVSPPLGGGASSSPYLPGSNTDLLLPTQLKVKVNCDVGHYVTLVVAFNISYQSLIDRIDAKINRFTTSSIAKGNLKLRYRDEDDDFVTIESDDDIQIAISEWREGLGNMPNGNVGEIELFCVGDMK